MSETNDDQNKKKTPLVWVVFILIIPAVAAIVLTFFVLSYTGVDVIDWAKTKVTETSLIASDEKEGDDTKKESVTDRDEHWRQKILAKNEQINELTEDVQRLESENQALQQDVEKVKKTNTTAEDKNEKLLTSIAQTFNNMNNKHAADIIDSLSDDLAVPILHQLSNDTRGNIMEVMEPERAAKLTERFIEQ